MRIVILLSLLLTACGEKRPDRLSAVCTEPLSKYFFDRFDYMRNPALKKRPDDSVAYDPSRFGIYEQDLLATDCLLSTARNYRTVSDAAPRVAKAVVLNCRRLLSDLEDMEYKSVCDPNGIEELFECENRKNIPPLRSLSLDERAREKVRQVKAAELATAEKYVIEARAGNCASVRGDRGGGRPSLLENVE